MESKRELIIEELKSRLKSIDGVVRIVEGGGSIEELQDFPTVFIFEEQEVSECTKIGMYEKTLPVQIEFFIKLSDTSLVYPEGRKVLREITTALEIDDRFSELCVKYAMSANQIFEMRPGVVDVVVVYDFVYVEKFLGHDVRRPFNF